MSLNAWNQLQALEKSIDAELSAPSATVAACPAGPQVHLICARYAARPNVDNQAPSTGDIDSSLPTLPKYDAGKNAGKTTS